MTGESKATATLLDDFLNAKKGEIVRCYLTGHMASIRTGTLVDFDDETLLVKPKASA